MVSPNLSDKKKSRPVSACRVTFERNRDLDDEDHGLKLSISSSSVRAGVQRIRPSSAPSARNVFSSVRPIPSAMAEPMSLETKFNRVTYMRSEDENQVDNSGILVAAAAAQVNTSVNNNNNVSRPSSTPGKPRATGISRAAASKSSHQRDMNHIKRVPLAVSFQAGKSKITVQPGNALEKVRSGKADCVIAPIHAEAPFNTPGLAKIIQRDGGIEHRRLLLFKLKHGDQDKSGIISIPVNAGHSYMAIYVVAPRWGSHAAAKCSQLLVDVLIDAFDRAAHEGCSAVVTSGIGATGTDMFPTDICAACHVRASQSVASKHFALSISFVIPESQSLLYSALIEQVRSSVTIDSIADNNAKSSAVVIAATNHHPKHHHKAPQKSKPDDDKIETKAKVYNEEKGSKVESMKMSRPASAIGRYKSLESQINLTPASTSSSFVIQESSSKDMFYNTDSNNKPDRSAKAAVAAQQPRPSSAPLPSSKQQHVMAKPIHAIMTNDQFGIPLLRTRDRALEGTLNPLRCLLQRQPAPPSGSFRVASYNVMSLERASDAMHCEPEARLWKSRGERIIKQIVWSQADIIGLQDVPESQWESLMCSLAQYGYVGYYHRMLLQRCGVAVCFKPSQWTYLKHKGVEPASQGDRAAAMTVLLQKKASFEILLVSSIQLCGHEDITCSQSPPISLQQHMDQLLSLFVHIEMGAPPSLRSRPTTVIVCADLDAEPESSLWQMASNSLRAKSGEIVPLRSAYEGEYIIPTKRSWDGTFNPDAIFYSSHHFKKLGTWNVPSVAEAADFGAGSTQPNRIFPSDHMLIAADLKFSFEGYDAEAQEIVGDTEEYPVPIESTLLWCLDTEKTGVKSGTQFRKVLRESTLK